MGVEGVGNPQAGRHTMPLAVLPSCLRFRLPSSPCAPRVKFRGRLLAPPFKYAVCEAIGSLDLKSFPKRAGSLTCLQPAGSLACLQRAGTVCSNELQDGEEEIRQGHSGPASAWGHASRMVPVVVMGPLGSP